MKKIIFVIDSLACAGAEKSLVTLLNLLDYSKYSVDLQLFAYSGELEYLVPTEVNILEQLSYSKFTSLSIKEAIFFSLKNRKINLIFTRLKFSLKVRMKKYTNAQKARVWWQCVDKAIEKSDIKYDIAISYAQGIPTFYVADKIEAERKFAWVNVSYRLIEKDKIFQKKYYKKFDTIVAVSHSAKKIFIETFPEFEGKTEVMYDINDFSLIKKMSDEVCDMGYVENKTVLLTVGRLAPQKGYFIALEACKILKEKNIEFRWYVLGKGGDEKQIREYIKENQLEEYFILLGVFSNPYPYIKNCDIYVQTSKFEGFGLAIAEARMLNKPVVTTKFDAVFNQMIHEKNGLVVEMNPQAVADGILRFINDTQLKNRVVEYLENEKKGNIEELEKFYELIR